MLSAYSDWPAEVNSQYYLPPSKRRKTKWLPVSLRLPRSKFFSINEAAVPKQTKMVTKFGLTVFNGEFV